MSSIDGSVSGIKKKGQYLFVLISISWIALIIGLFYISYSEHHESVILEAKSAASESYLKDLTYRKWASLHGGVYAPVSEHSPPNPYLKNVPERDIETPSGRKLTLINPAYMTRQIHELGLKEFGLHSHMTSLHPVNPVNAPDEWERKALQLFQAGSTEYSSIEYIGDKKHLRYMFALHVDGSCLKCHAEQGYRKGEIRGGISVSIPWERFFSTSDDHLKSVALIYGFIGLVGMLGIFASHRHFSRHSFDQELILNTLSNSESLLKTVLQAAPLGIGLVKDRVISWTNDSFRALLGYSTTEIYGQSTRILYESDDEFKRVGDFIYPQVGLYGETEIETRFLKKDGSTRDILLSLAAIDRNDLSKGVVFSVMDMTERKKTLQQLNEQTLRMQRAELAAKFGNWELNMSTRKIRGSKGALRVYGVESEEFDLVEVQSIPLPEYRPLLDEALRNLIVSQTAYDLEFKAVRQSDREIIDVHSIADFDPDNNAIWGVIQDITLRKKAEEALRESEAKYRFLTENMQDVIWSQAPDLTLTYISPSVENLLGYTPSEMIGKNFPEFFEPGSRDRVLERYRERMQFVEKNKTLSSAIYEVEMIRKDGSKIWIEMLSNPSIDSDGMLKGFHGVSRDISERKKSEQERLDLQKQLMHTQKLESLGILSGGIAHDFNNLLTVIIGNLQLGLREIDTDCRASRHVEKALKAANRSAGLAHQMLAYSGKGAMDVKDVNISEIVAENVQMLRTVIARTVSVEIDLDDDMSLVTCDPSQIQQLIMNLMINASESFSGKPGKIRLSTGMQYCDETILAGSMLSEKPEPQTMAYIRVGDNGCGMDSETLQRIFDPFFTTKFTGRGLGMSVAHGIVKGHHGAITIESEPGEGTVITVFFPVQDSPRGVREQKTPHLEAPLSGVDEEPVSKKISFLIVDDEEDVLELESRYLEILGYQNVIKATNGKQALDIFRANPNIDVVTLDLTMPEMDGVETFYRMIDIKPDIKVILCSGYSMEDIADRFKSGVEPSAFMKKPYSVTALKSILKELEASPR